MNWNNYQDVFDLFVNKQRVKRIWGKKKALKLAESQAASLFGFNDVELVNIHTGELVFHHYNN